MPVKKRPRRERMTGKNGKVGVSAYVEQEVADDIAFIQKKHKGSESSATAYILEAGREALRQKGELPALETVGA